MAFFMYLPSSITQRIDSSDSIFVHACDRESDTFGVGAEIGTLSEYFSTRS
jgi:hypothetical protein